MAVRKRILSMCVPWPWRYVLKSNSWHTIVLWTTIVWSIIQIQLGSEELWPAYWFWICVRCNLDFGDMTFGQGHYTTLGHRQRLCEILSRSKMTIRPGHGFWLCVHSDLNLGDTILGQGHDTPFGHGQQYLFFIVSNIIKIEQRSEAGILGMCALSPWPSTLVKVITHPLVMDKGQFCYLYTVGSISEIWLWVMVMSHS